MADVDVVSVRVRPNTRSFRSELRAEMRAIDEDFLVDIKVNVRPADLLEARADIERLGRDTTVHVGVDVDRSHVDQARQAVTAMRGEFDKLVSSGKALTGVTSDVLKGTLSLGTAFAKLAIGIAVVGALGSGVIQLGAGLVAASHAAGLLPGLLAGAGLAIATIKLGAEGIKKAFAGLEPVITQLKSAVSGAFQQSLTPAVNQAKTLIPQLTGGFRELATSIGSAGTSLTNAFKSSNGVETTNALLKTTSAITRDLASAFGPVVVGMLNIAKIGLDMFRPFTEGIGEAAKRFSDFTRSAEGAQKIRDFIQKGIDAFRTFGQIATNIGQTVSGVFRAIKKSSGESFGSIKDITGAMRDFVNSTEGQSTLVSLFTSLRGVISAVLPIVKTLADIIGNTLAPVIADIATAIGPALNRVFQGIGEALKAASPGIVALAEGFAGFIDGLRPALPMIGAVASSLGSTLGDALRNLAPPFLALIQDLAPHLPSVAAAIGKIAVAGLKLLDALTPLIGPVVKIATLFADNFVPVLEKLGPIIEPVAAALGTSLASAMEKIAPILPPLVEAFGQIVIAIAQGLMPVLPGLVSLIGPVAQAFILLTPVMLGLAIPLVIATGAAVALAQALSGDLKGALETTKQTAQTTGALTKQIIETDWAAMATAVQYQGGEIVKSTHNMGDGIISAMQEGVDGATGVLQNGLSPWDDLVAGATGSATGALTDGLSPWEPIASAAADGVSGAIEENSLKWSDFVETAMTGGGGAVGAMSDGMSSLVDEARQGVNAASGEVGALPPRVTGELSGTAQLLLNIGRSMMQGLTNGIVSAGNAAIAAASSIARQVVSIMSSVLRINSPSKVIRDKIGVAIPQGLAAGIEKDSNVALSAASRMASDVVTASSAAVDGVSSNFSSTLTVQAATASPIEIAANAAFDKVTEALAGWSVVLDPRGVATLNRAGAALNGKR